MREDHYLVPKQTGGSEKNIEHSLTANDIDDAEDLFVSAKERLLDVNNWAQYAGFAGITFTLADAKQKPLHRRAHPGDHVSIKINSTGADADWLAIGAIEYDDYPDEMRETLAVHIRPVAGPVNDASTTIVIDRTRTVLTASYHGRNELQNESNITAWLGLSDAEWTQLVQGFLK